MSEHTLFETGQRVRLPGQTQYVTVDDCRQTTGGWRLYLLDERGDITRHDLTTEQAVQVTVLAPDGNGSPHLLLAALWTEWMRAATLDAKATALATSPLRPYAHQTNAVYGAMLPQPRLRFLLADEPGTGKTIMAGLYLREMQRLGLVRRALVVTPAHLVSKWQADFERFFGGGLRRIRAATVHEGGLETAHDLWIVSLELAAVNPNVQEAIRPDRAGWDVVVFDEAHRLTPTAQALWRVGKLLAGNTPRALLMTATPHRGKDTLFRSLMHLVDPEVYEEPSSQETGQNNDRLTRPGRVHFLRRMKEDLLDYDGATRLFKGRHAQNEAVALGSTEAAYYAEALGLVDKYFPFNAVPLARMVYGKRAASSLHALHETLKRRREGMDSALPTAAALEADPDSEDVAAQDEARVVHEASRAARAEKSDLADIIGRLGKTLVDSHYLPSKWPRLTAVCLAAHGIQPGNGEQAVLFTEYADTADWLVARLRGAGYSAERYSGRDNHPERDAIRTRFEQRDFQIFVSTDAGNEGIDLQTAHVLVNWDIPWSLVRLEQRMGRIHRVGQTRDVELFNLVATDTREGAVLQVLLENFTIAANRLDGKIFDSLSVVAERVGVDLDKMLTQTYGEDDGRQVALKAAQAITAAQIEAAAKQAAQEEEVLKTTVDIASAVAALQRETLERINPRIVEAFLSRLTLTGFVQTEMHAAGEGLFLLTRTDGKVLPPELKGAGVVGESRALVASSGAALAAARAGGVQVAQAVSLGPSEAAFRALVADLQTELRPALFQGGTLVDPTSATGYDLYLYEAPVSESGGRRKTMWPFLLRVDDTGARPVRWELLANLDVGASPASATPPHPIRDTDAQNRALLLVREEETRRRAALAEWLAAADRELQRVPSALSSGIGDPTRRQATRDRLRKAVESRLAELRAMAEVVIGEPTRVGWARVLPAGPPKTASEADSEDIAVKYIAALLRADKWAVADVQTEGRGYDLHATKGRKQRCVEVKGVWQSAGSSGIRLTGNEVLMARQFGSDYVLYVVDHCANGHGTLFGVYENPTEVFGGLMKDVTVYQVPGSALSAARDEPK